MARAINKLTALTVKSKTKPGYYGDGGGLYLQVSPTGTTSWLFIYDMNGKQRQMGLGSTNDFSLAEARDEATVQRRLRREGLDPIVERDTRRQAAKLASANKMTFDQCAKQYIKDKKGEWSNEKHIDQWTNSLATYASPIIGSMLIADVDTPAVRRVLDPIWATKTETATRLRSRIEKIIDWAETNKYRPEGKNPALWTGHLKNVMAAPRKITPPKHFAALPYTQIPEFVGELRSMPGIAPLALEFTLLTAVRTQETTGAVWDEFDLREKIWTIPKKRMKMKRDHRVPLSGRALEILKQLDNEREGDHVFMGDKGKHISTGAMSAVVDRMNAGERGPSWIDPTMDKPITVHGTVRSGFMDWASETTAYPKEVRDMALAHAVGDKVEEAYRRGDLYQKRVSIMEDWATYCASGLL